MTANKKLHENEIDIDLPLVKQLLSEQFPQWSKLSIRPVPSDGTENAIYQLGENMCVRLPRLPEVSHQIEKEKKWLPQLARLLPLEIPVPLEKGNPTKSYPFHWSIYRWLEGENAATGKINNLHQAASDLANFIIALQKIASVDAPLSARGVPLIMQDNETRNAIKSLKEVVDADAVTAIWEECLQAPEWNKPPVWIHGDLLPANLLLQEGRLSAVIDFGFLGIGDPACDLIPAWSIFSSETREIFRNKLTVDNATWLRGRGWALSIALIILPYYHSSNPGLVAVAQRMINEILAEK